MKTTLDSVITRLVLVLLCLLSVRLHGAHPLDDLQTRYPLPANQELNNAAYGNGTWVIVGNSGFVLTTSDLLNWQTGSVGVSGNLREVIFVNNQFVTVGGGRCFTSPDGLSWTEQAGGLGSVDGGIAFGNGIYMAVGNFGNIAVSINLTDWTFPDTGDDNHLYGVTFADGRFVAVGNNGTIVQGISGESLTVTQTTAELRLNAVVYGDNQFVISGHSGQIVTSPDGINWTEQGSIGSTALFALHYGNGVYIASGGFLGVDSDAIYRSTNGIDWAPVSSQFLTEFLDGGAFGNGTFLLLARHYIQTSTDGLAWSFASSSPMFIPTWAAQLNGTYVGAASGPATGQVGTSDDGIAWTTQDSSPSGFSGAHIDATDAEGFFLICGRNNSTFEGYIIRTQNGVEWTKAYSTGTEPQENGGIWGIDHGNGKFLACGERGRILFSDDAVTWEVKRFLGTPEQLRGMAYGAGLYVVVGDDGLILSSTDGLSWAPMTSGVTSRLEDVAFHAGRFVVAPYDSRTMLTSTDGITWTEIETTTLALPRRIKVINDEFVVPGFVSPDGVNWSQHPFGGEVVFDGTSYFVYSGTSIRSSTTSTPTLIIDSISRQGDDIVIEWISGGVLQSRPGVGVGEWNDVTGAGSPHQFVNPGVDEAIFRLRAE